MTVHEWRGLRLAIRVTASACNSRLLEITRFDGNSSLQGSESDGLEFRRLRCAASIVLELDATLARSARQGQVVRIEAMRPRSKLPSRPGVYMRRWPQGPLLRI